MSGRLRRRLGPVLCATLLCTASLTVPTALSTGVAAARAAPATQTPMTQTPATPTPATPTPAALTPLPVRDRAVPIPTQSGPSPTLPDPHPPEGGHAPDGTVVGGPELLSRSVVQVSGSPALPAGISARAFMVTDLDTGEVLAARDPHGRYQPASVLKLLTSLTILPRLPGNRVIVASNRAANAEGSTVGLVPGGRYTVDTLFKALLLMSGNDAAVALSEAAGGVSRTVAAMNARAGALGAYDTVVETPSGLDGWRQLTSAYDLTLVLRAAVNNPRLLAYDRAGTAALPAQGVGKRKWRAVPLFNQSQDFFDDVPGALLAKTGFTDAAQHTYVCATGRHGRRIGVVLLRAQRRPLDQFQQAAALLDWAYRLPSSAKAVGLLSGSPATASPLPSVTAAPAPSGSAAAPTTTGPQRSGAASSAKARSARLGSTRAAILVATALAAMLAMLIAAGTVASRRRRH